MTNKTNRSIMDATRSFTKDFKWTDLVAVTLTMKKAIRHDGGFIRAAPSDHSRNLRHFLNALNKRIYSGFARKGWVLSVVSVLERGAFDRDHYHLTIDKPPHLTIEEYASIIETEWRKTTWGYDQVDVSADGGERWINYITKQRTKVGYAEAIDWLNTYESTVSLAELKLPLRLKMKRQTFRELAEKVRRHAAEHYTS